MDSLFDIVILLGPNDIDVIYEQIKYTKKNIIGFRKIFIIAFENIQIEDCIVIHENKFQFTKKDVEYFHGNTNRIGWYLQQLLKLYASRVIPDILEKYLVIDSDTFFLRPTTFIENNICLYATSKERNRNYFYHMAKLHPSLHRILPLSGICHHMMFEKKYVDSLIEMVEEYHMEINKSWKPFWQIFIESVDKNHLHGAGASEYEIYFNYMIQYHRDKILIRDLHWRNIKDIHLLEDTSYDFCSYHHYMRPK